MKKLIAQDNFIMGDAGVIVGDGVRRATNKELNNTQVVSVSRTVATGEGVIVYEDGDVFNVENGVMYETTEEVIGNQRLRLSHSYADERGIFK